MSPVRWQQLLDEAYFSKSLTALHQQMQQSWSNAAMHDIYPVAGGCTKDWQLYKKNTLSVTGFHTELGAAAAVNLMLPTDRSEEIEGVSI